MRGPLHLVELNPLATRVHDLMAGFTSFPKPILVAQCKHIGKTPSTLEPGDLARLAPYVGNAVALFSNPGKGKELETAILKLAGP